MWQRRRMTVSHDGPTLRQRLLQHGAHELRANGLTQLSFASVSNVDDGSGTAAPANAAAQFENLAAFQAAALEAAMSHLRQHVEPPGSGVGALTRFATQYCSEEHRVSPADGCPMAAAGSEIVRAPKVVRASFEVQLELLFRDLKDASGAQRDQVVAEIALCVGAMTLARAVESEALARDILRAARDAITRTLP
jgi:TetR/AcrR family transcriptional repressor of nem operon